jgi:3-deoxy-manno-octulosonate cytidylyltransferase (CMP-KDO synthetase)
VRARSGDASPVYRHVGIYAYRLAVLERYIGLAATPFETSEGLEQLRLLEHGIPIRVVETSMRGRTNWSVDTPQDIAIVEEILKREGEVGGSTAR